jgi:hypothetical protein
LEKALLLPGGTHGGILRMYSSGMIPEVYLVAYRYDTRTVPGRLAYSRLNVDGTDAFGLLFERSRATPRSFSKMAAEKPGGSVS